MQHGRQLSPCLIHDGTVTTVKDMVRALETLESVRYEQHVDGEVIAEGQATLVKLMADSESSTILVNSCLFLNVGSFHYVTFTTMRDGECVFELVGDGMRLVLHPIDTPTLETRTGLRILDESAFDPEPFVVLEEDDEEE